MTIICLSHNTVKDEVIGTASPDHSKDPKVMGTENISSDKDVILILIEHPDSEGRKTVIFSKGYSHTINKGKKATHQEEKILVTNRKPCLVLPNARLVSPNTDHHQGQE